MGINFGNIQISLWALGFHVGLAAIFGLYFVFWLQLNAFVTLKYLALVGVPTFVCGHRLLHGIAVSKQYVAPTSSDLCSILSASVAWFRKKAE